MKIIAVRDTLHDGRILSVISHSLFMPTAETLRTLADRCETNPSVFAFACEDHGAILGAVILQHISGQAYEILHIATDPAHRGKGVASRLIAHAVKTLACAALVAETDCDAVGFYRKYGFRIKSLGEKYPGVIRYRCTWKPE